VTVVVPFVLRWRLHHALSFSLALAVNIIVALAPQLTFAIVIPDVATVVFPPTFATFTITIHSPVSLLIAYAFCPQALLLLALQPLLLVVVNLRSSVATMRLVARVTVLLPLEALIAASSVAVLTITSDSKAATLHTTIRTLRSVLSSYAVAAFVTTWLSTLIVFILLVVLPLIMSVLGGRTRGDIVRIPLVVVGAGAGIRVSTT
jgi:hypothetical protein